VVPGNQTLAGDGNVLGAITIGGTAKVSPGISVGTLTTTGSVTLGPLGNYNWQIANAAGTAGGTGWDLLSTSGVLDVQATSASPFAINLWSLSGTNPTVDGNAANFNPNQSYTWKIAHAGGGIANFATEKFVINTGSTSFGTGGFTNSLSGGTFSITQSGNDLNLVFTSTAAPTPSSITINVGSGTTQTQTQAGYPTLSGSIPVVKTGAGTLVITAANTLTGSMSVQQGTLQLANAAALASSKVIPVAGGTVSLAPYLQTTVGGLAPNAGGLVNLGNGLVTVASGLTATDLVTAIVAGRGDGSWTGTSGITSSVAAADVAVSIPRAVGWLDNGDGSVTAAFAAPGDTNLDWVVDVLDASNFLSFGKYDTGLPATWLEGDFNYDGVVDVLDASDFFGTGLYDTGNYNTPLGASGIAAVPEPSTTALAALAVAGWAAIGQVRRIRSRGLRDR
jgi:autotransporter-associated beta strand protein